MLFSQLYLRIFFLLHLTLFSVLLLICGIQSHTHAHAYTNMLVDNPVSEHTFEIPCKFYFSFRCISFLMKWILSLIIQRFFYLNMLHVLQMCLFRIFFFNHWNSHTTQKIEWNFMTRWKYIQTSMELLIVAWNYYKREPISYWIDWTMELICRCCL